MAIIAMSTVGWIITTAIRARHGYPVEGEWGGSVVKDDPLTKRLETENADLRAELGLVKDRLATIERIVTDRGVDTAAQIEALRAPRLSVQGDIN
ncbi:hypothetical protein [Sphingomonas sp. RB1R13]|uniref:hypothetical protein n=1 Tax=Sphingomonas sp. RB1R13 TaxID=3096159 RepID=UPI002FCA08A3